MFEIEKNVEMPISHGRGRAEKYPWGPMEVGDSFFVPEKTSKAFYTVALNASKRYGRTFAVRAVEGGVRVWRTK